MLVPGIDIYLPGLQEMLDNVQVSHGHGCSQRRQTVLHVRAIDLDSVVLK
jgi:hypothetical protein